VVDGIHVDVRQAWFGSTNLGLDVSARQSQCENLIRAEFDGNIRKKFLGQRGEVRWGFCGNVYALLLALTTGRDRRSGRLSVGSHVSPSNGVAVDGVYRRRDR
jgi:hypothetical protein